MDRERRLDLLEVHATKTESRLSNIEDRQAHQGVILDSHSSKLDQIVMAVTRHESAPKFDFPKSLQVVRDIFVICSVIGGLAIWLVLTLTAANDQVTGIKISQLEKELSRLQVPGYAPGSWKPSIEPRQ